MPKFFKAQRGDTIIEVLIAIAVASSVLAVTYSTMNRNLTITRTSQERSEAGKIAQGQLESLKGRIDQGLALGTTFCVNASSSVVNLPSTVPDAIIANDNFSQYATCIASGIYHYVIKLVSPNTYRIHVRWDRVNGGVREEVIMVYKT